MSYIKSSYSKSKWMKDEGFKQLITRILELGGEEQLRLDFETEVELNRVRYGLYSMLNSLGRKGEYRLSKKSEKDGWALIVEYAPMSYTSVPYRQRVETIKKEID